MTTETTLPITTTTIASTGHTLTADRDTQVLTIAGSAETMDSIPDADIDAAAAAVGCSVDWAAGPIDETRYGLLVTGFDETEG